MQEETQVSSSAAAEEQATPPPPVVHRGMGLVWRLAQIVLVLAAAYLYFFLGSFGGRLHDDRLWGNPHTWPLVQAALVGAGIGLCIGLALKDFSKSDISLSIDWPTVIFNLLGASVFIAVAVALNTAALNNVEALRGPIKDAVVLSPLLPFIWVGLTLTTVVRGKD